MRQMKDSGIEWIGEIPESWKVLFAFQCFSQVKNKNEGLSETNLLSLSYGKLKRKSMDTTEGLLPESFESYNIIEANDIVLRLTDLQNDHTSLRVGLSEERGIITSAYVTLRNYSKNVPKYLYYYLHSYDIAKGFYGMGAGVRQGLNWEGLKHLKMLAPTPQEQQKISTYLDRQCGLIDNVIEKTKASIEEYKKLRQAVITQAVTKGVRGDRPMKDSGIERIEKIPSEWSELKMKYFMYIRARLGWKGLKADEYVDEGYIFIGTPNIDDRGNIDWINVNYITKERYDESPEIMLSEGDVLLTKDGAGIGKCAYIDKLPSEATPNGSLAVITCNELMKGKYLFYYLKSYYFQKYIDQIKAGMGVPHLFQGDLREITIAVPSIEEQLEITEYLDKKCAEIDSLITKKEQFLTELDTYKKSLIYEYVTGKKEVPQNEC